MGVQVKDIKFLRLLIENFSIIIQTNGSFKTTDTFRTDVVLSSV